MNGDLEAAVACDADGVHLPSDAAWRDLGAAVRQQGLLLGVSTHSLAELEAASESGAHYALFGPVFDSPEKRRFGPAQGLERLRRAVSVDLPVLAVGGVDAGNAASIAHAGAHGGRGCDQGLPRPASGGGSRDRLDRGGWYDAAP